MTAKLYDVNKEVEYLTYLSTVWLPSSTKAAEIDQSNQAAKNRLFQSDHFRADLDILISELSGSKRNFLLIRSISPVELWSSRTTLILSVIFVLIYIFSWGFLAYCVRETRSVVSSDDFFFLWLSVEHA